MENFLPSFILVMFLVAVFGIINEKTTKFNEEIAYMLFSVLSGAIILVFSWFFHFERGVKEVIFTAHYYDINDFLMHGVLCFMLFAATHHMKLEDFDVKSRQLTVLAVFGTLLTTLLYGGLFHLASNIFNLGFTIPISLMFGSIVAPTDPIAATGILKKYGLPKGINFLIEAESVLNDGVSASLFVFFSSMVATQARGNFFAIMGQQLFGAIAVGVGVCLVTYPLFSFTHENIHRIVISLLAVSSAYYICEHFHFSGPIAAVVIGLLFSYCRRWEHRNRGREWNLKSYMAFWNILETLLNSILYVMLGLSFFRILNMQNVILISVLAIIINLISRGTSVTVATFFMGKIPDHYDRKSFIKLFTWGALRGGLSIALAMSTKNFLDPSIFNTILGATYAVVFFTTVVQGLSIKKLYDSITVELNANNNH